MDGDRESLPLGERLREIWTAPSRRQGFRGQRLSRNEISQRREASIAAIENQVPDNKNYLINEFFDLLDSSVDYDTIKFDKFNEQFFREGMKKEDNIDDQFPNDNDTLSIVRELRSDFEKFIARRNSDLAPRFVDWPGVRKAGMSASDWIKQHYSDEIEQGIFRISDIREHPKAPGKYTPLYKALFNEARRAGLDPSALVPSTTAINERRRELLGRLMGREEDDPALGEFFSAARKSGGSSKGRG